MVTDTSRGIRFRAWDRGAAVYTGETAEDWAALPEPLVLVDVYLEQTLTSGRHYRWRMECEWYGCRTCCGGRLEFARWHDEHRPRDETWAWKVGVLISDAAMQAVREQAG